MKHIISFNLPEDNYELECAMKGYKLKRVIDDLDKELRDVVKYGSPDFYNSLNATGEEDHSELLNLILEKVRERIRDYVDANDARFENE